MENALSNISPVQAFIILAIQLWAIVAPIIILQKISRLTRLLEEAPVDQPSEHSSGNGA